MMAAHQHQWGTDAARGGRAGLAVARRFAVDAHKSQTFLGHGAPWPRVATGRGFTVPVLFSFMPGHLPSSTMGGRSLMDGCASRRQLWARGARCVDSRAIRSAHHFIRGWSGSPHDIADAFRLRAAGLREEQIGALLNFGAHSGALVEASDHSPCRVTDQPPVVQVRLSQSAGFDDPDTNERQLEPCSLNQVIEYPR